MRTLRLLVFCVAVALLTGSVTTAAVRADDGTDAVSKAEKSAKSKKPPKKDKDDTTPDGTSPKGANGPEGRSTDAPISLPAKPVDPAAVELPEAPVLGETLGAKPGKGDVSVKLPGEDAFTDLDATDTIPMGSTVDATHGLVEIVVEAAPDGTRQSAVVTGSQFTVTQTAPAAAAPAYTDFTLRGGDFSWCADGDPVRGAARRGGPTARAAGKRRTRGGVSRGLWASAKGNFRTRGRHSAATVRGTRWAIVDRCKSTTVKVFEGVVDVHDFDLDEVFTLRAGDRLVSR